MLSMASVFLAFNGRIKTGGVSQKCPHPKLLKIWGYPAASIRLLPPFNEDPTGDLMGPVAGFALDANGWPIITRQSNSRVIYVSSSTGNDNNNGLTPQTAVATLAKGESLLRNGYPDQLLLKAGDTFVNQSFGDLTVSGQSATAPMVIGTYGTGPAPVVETTPNTNWGVGIGSLPGRGG